MRRFKKAFRRLPDPRAANARHDLLEVLIIALAATLCGAESCSDMADFGEAKKELLRLFLRLEHGVPSHDTFSRVFRLLKPEAFEAAFRRFLPAFATANAVKRPAGTRRQAPWKCWSFSACRAVSSPPMRCIAAAPLPVQCCNGVPIMRWQ